MGRTARAVEIAFRNSKGAQAPHRTASHRRVEAMEAVMTGWSSDMFGRQGKVRSRAVASPDLEVKGEARREQGRDRHTLTTAKHHPAGGHCAAKSREIECESRRKIATATSRGGSPARGHPSSDAPRSSSCHVADDQRDAGG